MKFNHIITGFFALCLSFTLQAKTAPTPQQAPQKPAPMPEWIMLGESDVGVYDVQTSSISWLREPLAVEFTLRSRFKNVSAENGFLTQTIERTVALCNEDMILMVQQKQFRNDGKTAVFNKTIIYVNPDNENSLTTRLLDLFCGATPESMKKESAPASPLQVPIKSKKKLSV